MNAIHYVLNRLASPPRWAVLTLMAIAVAVTTVNVIDGNAFGAAAGALAVGIWYDAVTRPNR